jgi:hypothetical protein
MHYRFRVAEELFWFLVVFVGIALMEVLISFDPNEITDWRFYAKALAGAAVRAIAAGILAFSRRTVEA